MSPMLFGPKYCPKCGMLPHAVVIRVLPLTTIAYVECANGKFVFTGDTEDDDIREVVVRDKIGRVTLACEAGHRWKAMATGVGD